MMSMKAILPYIIFITLFSHFQVSQCGHSQWISIKIENKAKGHTFKIENGYLHWGKWFGNTKDNSVGPPSGDIAFNAEKTINSCGREHAWSGTEGSFNIYDEHYNYIAHVTWDCPWGARQNRYQVEMKSNRFKLHANTNHLYDGAIGQRTITITKNDV
jgi:hypothetical protein